jgi:hypothetical protein
VSPSGRLSPTICRKSAFIPESNSDVWQRISAGGAVQVQELSTCQVASSEAARYTMTYSSEIPPRLAVLGSSTLHVISVGLEVST